MKRSRKKSRRNLSRPVPRLHKCGIDVRLIETAKKRIAEAEERETWRHSDQWTQRHVD